MNGQPTPARVALKWGLILGIALIVYSLALFLTDNVGNTGLGFISYALSIGGIILAMREFRTLNGGYMSYGEGLTVGTLTSGISGLLSSLFSTFYTTVIDTGVMERMADQTREKLEESGVSDEVIEQQMEFVKMFQSPGLLFVFGVIGSIVLGLIFSLIIAAFMKKTKENPF
ncbi:DUF4199 domain-containing protein [Spirosoma montaniterrae]|uniref:DUF4199 domain-containing protein n=1 Tax=Spirosoma montaniterrae TaxID=1178516 RepID=A0A1P9X3K0_9BACT|nr:DUF4199 domain-containing protein [Spirosoma montaniterrae]AQG82214.1 hypothetical protein AWR27_24710 [Spirosoma montaniterrae]